jgi:hypothetical protein
VALRALSGESGRCGGQVLPASVAVAVTHAGLWNTLHPDTHAVVLSDDERMSDSQGAAYVQWLSDALGCVRPPLPLPPTSTHLPRSAVARCC